MRLWSIQSKIAYDIMLQTGSLRADEEHLLFEGDLKESYIWMADQMKKRLGQPPEGVKFPVWAWYQWEGRRKRPDMRTHGRSWGDKGVEIVLLTLEVPDDQVLLSDFDYWHVVLNDGDLVFSFDYDAEYPEDVKRKSWEQIFDYTCSFVGEPEHVLSTQATMWEIRKEWILRTEHFKSR